MSYFQVKNLNFKIGKKYILKNINFSLNKGDILTILGLSGAGKSTILKLIVGLLKPDSGDILINEKSILKENTDIRISMVFQYSALFDSMTIYENLKFPLIELNIEKDEERIKNKIKEFLKMVDMEGSENLYPDQLSGGMKKRIAFARGLIYNPDIILYDEPTSGLDPIMSNVIHKLIRDFKKRFNITSIIVSHDVNLALRYSDKLAILYNGEIMYMNNAEEFRKSNNPIVKQFISGDINGPIKV